MSDKPDPLTPPDSNLQGLEWVALDIVRLLDSDLYALSTGDEFKAAFTLWMRAFFQIPAGSLSRDERVLAHLSGAGKNWPKVREVALRGWEECSDGRLYHPVVAEKARDAWERRKKERTRKKNWRDNKRCANDSASGQDAGVPRDTTGTGGGTTASGPMLVPADRIGQDRIGQDKEEKPASSRAYATGPLPGETVEPGTGKRLVGGFYIDDVWNDLLDIAGLDAARWPGDQRPLAQWLNDGIVPDTIRAAFRSVAARPGYQPPATLRYFDGPVREEARLLRSRGRAA